jgi:hypothetical protein
MGAFLMRAALYHQVLARSDLAARHTVVAMVAAIAAAIFAAAAVPLGVRQTKVFALLGIHAFGGFLRAALNVRLLAAVVAAAVVQLRSIGCPQDRRQHKRRGRNR